MGNLRSEEMMEVINSGRFCRVAMCMNQRAYVFPMCYKTECIENSLYIKLTSICSDESVELPLDNPLITIEFEFIGGDYIYTVNLEGLITKICVDDNSKYNILVKPLELNGRYFKNCECMI
ncbi:MAG: hypothetical protein RR806_00860 [Oscillospiraceae bacterium]